MRTITPDPDPGSALPAPAEARSANPPDAEQNAAGAARALAGAGRPARRWRLAALPTSEAAIAVGAVLGASARFTISSMAGPFAPQGLPLGTLTVNLVGCLLIGMMQTLFLELINVRREVQLFVAVGLLGGLTTFSSVSVESVRLIQAGALPSAASYQFISLFGGVLAALLGIVLAQLGHRVLVGRIRE